MDLPLPHQLTNQLDLVMRRAGYHQSTDPNVEKTSYIRRIYNDYYPRFHAYFKQRDGQVIINLHLDQKKPSYAGAHAHNADYDSETVLREGQRILGVITTELNNLAQAPARVKKEGFFSRLFN